MEEFISHMFNVRWDVDKKCVFFIDSSGDDSVPDWIPYPVEQGLEVFNWKLFSSWALSYYINILARIKGASKRLREEDTEPKECVEVLDGDKNFEIRTSKRIRKAVEVLAGEKGQ
jgi:hypothetical protein